MTRTSINSTTLALLSTNEQDEMMSNKDTACEDRNQGALIAPLRFIIPLTQDEVLLIKGWDSDTDRARFTPHTAFEPPNTMPDAPARESIEVRTYAILPGTR